MVRKDYVVNANEAVAWDSFTCSHCDKEFIKSFRCVDYIVIVCPECDKIVCVGKPLFDEIKPFFFRGI